MKAVFVEFRVFERNRERYLDDDDSRELQTWLMAHPEAGELIPGAGGLRKLRFGDARRGKGKRGGLRVICYFWFDRSEFWLFTLYDRNEMSDLTIEHKTVLKELLKSELKSRKN